MSKALLKSIGIGITGISSSLGITIPLANNKVPETSIKKTIFIAGKSSREYFGELNNSNGRVTGIDK